MKGYYELMDKLRGMALTNPLINTVTKGAIDKIANAKVDMYPICHLQLNSQQVQGNISIYNISFILMDIVETNKNLNTDIFYGNDNEDDVLHQMNEVALYFYEQFRRGGMNDTYLMQLVSDVANVEYFVDRFVDRVAGCTLTLDIAIHHQATIC